MQAPTPDDINDGHWVEAQHVSHMMVGMFDDYVCNHPAIRQTPELAARAEAILEALGDLYQAVGRLRPDIMPS